MGPQLMLLLKFCSLGCDPLTKYQAAQQYLQVTAKFEADHLQDYCGTAVIIAQSRKTSEVESHLKLTSKLQKEHPDFFLGAVLEFSILPYFCHLHSR